jgi:hypothetical protein
MLIDYAAYAKSWCDVEYDRLKFLKDHKQSPETLVFPDHRGGCKNTLDSNCSRK